MKYFKILFPLIGVGLLFQSCLKKKPLFSLVNTDTSGISFSNIIEESKDFNPINYIYIYNGAGVGVGDVNNDGLPDLFFAGNQVPSKLYLNRGNMRFEDVTESSKIDVVGWAVGVNMVDINADGHLDIYLSMADKDYGDIGRNQLWMNKGDGTFEEWASSYGIDDVGYSTQTAFFDYDRDGDLDMYLLNNGIETFSHNNTRPRKTTGTGISTDKLYQNNGDGSFSDVSIEAGITIEGYGLGVGVFDANADGWPDIYCSNDFITNDLLWVNNQDGTFTESLASHFVQTSYNGMGMDIADFNNDGLLDVVQVDMLPETNKHRKTMTPAMNYNNQEIRFGMGYHPQYVRNTLQLNSSDNTFSEMGRLGNIHDTDWSWSPLLADFDNDGLKDLFISNGYGRDITDLDYINFSELTQNPFGTPEARDSMAYNEMRALPPINLPNYFYKNSNGLEFKNTSGDWSEGQSSMSYGAVYADLDLDGDLDIVTNNLNGEAFLYQNNTNDLNPQHFVHVELKYIDGNINALGAEVHLYASNGKQTAYKMTNHGYASSIEGPLHFGLGNTTHIDSIAVIWPNGLRQLEKNSAIDTTVTISYDKTAAHPKLKQRPNRVFLEEDQNAFAEISHKENAFIDFLEQPLLQRMLSREGPSVAIGDVDNDGLEDFFLGSALQDTSYIYQQEVDGTFHKKWSLPNSWQHEDAGAILVDVDDDGLLDIYVSSGGNELPYGASGYADRLYLQQPGEGFRISEDNTRKALGSSTVNAVDFDQDGDLDLFVGTRLKPKHYPYSEKSRLLINDGGRLVDATNTHAPELAELGMVTAALWTDYDDDGLFDLIVVGEWMQVEFFKNVGGQLVRNTNKTSVEGLFGFWNSINGADIDLDGDTDYILGNLGLNTDFRASSERPIHIIAKDFDKNGSIDPIIGHYIGDELVPVATRDAMNSQLVGMKKRFPRYIDYAQTDFDRMLTDNEKEGALTAKVTVLKSGYLENLGNGDFAFHPLPLEAQMAPVFGICVADVNLDGRPDLVLGGNRKDSETLGGFQEGSKGVVLIGQAQGGFKTASLRASGFKAPNDVRAITRINSNGRLGILVGNNDGQLQNYVLSGELKSIYVPKEIMTIRFVLDDNQVLKKELYLGSGYLSQDSRYIQVPHKTKKIICIDSQGVERPLEIPIP